MDPKHLWAKSWPGDREAPQSAYFAEHLWDVYNAALSVIEQTGADQLAAFGIEPESQLCRFRNIVSLAAIVHDLGKANDHFQGMLTGQRNIQDNPQGLRHEWVTLLMLHSLYEWLLPALENEADWAIIEWAVAGHHPGIHHPSPPETSRDGSGDPLTMLMGHPDFARALELIQTEFQLKTPPVLENVTRNLCGSNIVFDDLRKWSARSRRMWDRFNPIEKRFVAAAKDCLIAADIAGSAVPKLEPSLVSPYGWVKRAFDSKPQKGDLDSVVQFRLGEHSPRDFQSMVAYSVSSITFVKAGCGSGKTLAAYMWAARNHPLRRLYFCYPTTGTATEGFRDYLFNTDEQIPRIGAKLFHSRSDIDFEVILGTGSDVNDMVQRIESLDAWSTPVASCTVDAVLGVMQNNRRGMFAWPALAQSAFVFDEIHAFDEELFGTLLRFLKEFPGLPVLLMTASLPDEREEALRRIVEARGDEWSPICGPKELEQISRYHVAEGDSLTSVRSILEADGKVLWVCNTVARAMGAALEMAHWNPAIYHSRFKYIDRVQRHQDVISSFNEDSIASIAICTQVAEMSLDLSADLLVTDLAPIPSLIQRLGRLNRRARDGDPTKPFIVIEPENSLPYEDDQLQESRNWLGKLPVAISQQDLIQVWEQADVRPPKPKESPWIDGGPVTEVHPLRKGSIGISILLESDFRSVESSPRTLGKYVLPMPEPRQTDWKSWKRFRGIPVCPDELIQYDELRGAQWRK